ncbi:hypothetical protein ['Camptotheca acuminata' phytoplasma]
MAWSGYFSVFFALFRILVVSVSFEVILTLFSLVFFCSSDSQPT